jgi:hypothetical protein
MPDVVTRLKDADPLIGPYELDPSEAQHLLMRARTTRAVARPPRRARAPLAAGVTLAAAAVAAVAVTGGGGSALGPADALAQAVSRTADFDSGVITYHLTADSPGYTADATQKLRFSGTDVELVQRATETLPSGTHEDHNLTIRSVGDHAYIQNDGGDGAWQQIGPSGTGDGYASGVKAAIGNHALTELVQNSSDVTRDGSTFRATVDGAALQALPVVPFGLDKGPAIAQATVTVTLADDGTIQRIAIDTPGSERTAEYSELGAPQPIADPEPSAAVK